MKKYLFLFLLLPSLIFSMENFEHKKKLRLEHHLEYLQVIVNDVKEKIPSAKFDELHFHIKEMQYLLGHTETTE